MLVWWGLRHWMLRFPESLGYFDLNSAYWAWNSYGDDYIAWEIHSQSHCKVIHLDVPTVSTIAYILSLYLHTYIPFGEKTSSHLRAFLILFSSHPVAFPSVSSIDELSPSFPTRLLASPFIVSSHFSIFTNQPPNLKIPLPKNLPPRRNKTLLIPSKSCSSIPNKTSNQNPSHISQLNHNPLSHLLIF